MTTETRDANNIIKVSEIGKDIFVNIDQLVDHFNTLIIGEPNPTIKMAYTLAYQQLLIVRRRAHNLFAGPKCTFPKDNVIGRVD